jgi:hypothetical protein
MLTLMGFLSTRALDLKMDIPSQFSPSRVDLPIVGLQTLTMPITYCFVFVVAFVVVKFVIRFSLYGLGRLPTIGETLETWPRRTYGHWRKLWQGVEPVTIAETFFIAATVLSVAVLGAFRHLLAAMLTDDIEVLSCASRPLHRSYFFFMTILVVCLWLAWHRVFRYLRMRQGGGAGVTVTRWGGLAGIGMLVIFLTLPWRILYNNYSERALLDGERAYILVETEADLVLYNAERQSTTYYRKGEEPVMERQGTIGYAFEEAAMFITEGPGC